MNINRRALDIDRRMMQLAIQLALKGKGRTSPNPAVGAVVVSNDGNGRVVGRGYHRKAGGPHAEVFALEEAGAAARGATLYVTLEPCCHQGRTPPCTDRIIAAGIRRVVVGSIDPNPRVAGKGIEQLRAAGIDVSTGVLEVATRRLNEGFNKVMETGLPFVLYKYAMTLDGKTATSAGHSQWISSPAARLLVHQWRNEYDAIMVGSGTVVADNPRLTCRIAGGRDPARVIVDTQGRIAANSRVLHLESPAPTIVAVGSDDASRRLREGIAAGGQSTAGSSATSSSTASREVIVCGTTNSRVDLKALLRELPRRGINSVLLEGGSTLAYSMLAAGLVDKVAAFVAPKLAGGRGAPSPLGGFGVSRMDESWQLTEVEYSPVGGDILVEGYVMGPGTERE